MFGLEGNKKKSGKAFVFDLERDLQDVSQKKALSKHVKGRTQEIKGLLRKGENKKQFDELGILLHGYTSFLKVIDRVGTK